MSCALRYCDRLVLDVSGDFTTVIVTLLRGYSNNIKGYKKVSNSSYMACFLNFRRKSVGNMNSSTEHLLLPKHKVSLCWCLFWVDKTLVLFPKLKQLLGTKSELLLKIYLKRNFHQFWKWLGLPRTITEWIIASSGKCFFCCISIKVMLDSIVLFLGHVCICISSLNTVFSCLTDCTVSSFCFM